MTDTLLSIENLRISFGPKANPFHPVDGASITLKRGIVHALIGESGCGKSLTALATLQLLPYPAARISEGKIFFKGENLLEYNQSQMRAVRGQQISIIFQEPMTSLNPVLTIKAQLLECLRHRSDLTSGHKQDLLASLLDEVGLPNPQKVLTQYPHELSGGMKQRVMIAIALAGDPELLIADEPTTALDVTIQAQVLDLLLSLRESRDLSLLIITHDLGVASQIADEMSVMYSGEIVEHGSVKTFFQNPLHPYSEKLIGSVPDMKRRSHALAVIPGQVQDPRLRTHGCRFADRCSFQRSECLSEHPQLLKVKYNGELSDVRCILYKDESIKRSEHTYLSNTNSEISPKSEQEDTVLLEVKNLIVEYAERKAHPLARRTYFRAVDQISFSIQKGETLALVGESGCGKTSAAMAIARLLSSPVQGTITVLDNELRNIPENHLRQQIQCVFQDPYNSMNPRLTAREIISEPLICSSNLNRSEIRTQVRKLLDDVGLPVSSLDRYPNEFSGGQRQRLAIARALALSPQLIICDEPTSALDVSVQAQILNLLKSLQLERAISFLFITHNISVVEYIAHSVAVMFKGKIVEQGDVFKVLRHSTHPYTTKLLSAVPHFEAPQSQIEIA